MTEYSPEQIARAVEIVRVITVDGSVVYYVPEQKLTNLIETCKIIGHREEYLVWRKGCDEGIDETHPLPPELASLKP